MQLIFLMTAASVTLGSFVGVPVLAAMMLEWPAHPEMYARIFDIFGVGSNVFCVVLLIRHWRTRFRNRHVARQADWWRPPSRVPY